MRQQTRDGSRPAQMESIKRQSLTIADAKIEHSITISKAFLVIAGKGKNIFMIYDKIDNIATYEGLSKDIYEGLAFLRAMKEDIEIGVHVINPKVKAIVSEYTTKEVNEKGYEAHHEYIDIQYLISGEELVCNIPLEYLKEIKAYNNEKDVAFLPSFSLKTAICRNSA